MSDKAILAAVIIAFNEGLKRLGMPAKACIIVSWVVGVGVGIVDALVNSLNIYPAVLEGFLIGSAASGLYDAGRVGFNKLKEAANGQHKGAKTK